MMNTIVTIDELHQGSSPDVLSPLLVDTINELLKEGKENGEHNVTITSTNDNVLKELYDKRKTVMRLLTLSGYSYSTNSDTFMEESTNIGWDLAPRVFEDVPDKLLQGKNYAVRGNFSYKNFRLWVNIDLPK